MNDNDHNDDNNDEFAVAFPRGGSSSTVSRSNWNLEVLYITEVLNININIYIRNKFYIYKTNFLY